MSTALAGGQDLNKSVFDLLLFLFFNSFGKMILLHAFRHCLLVKTALNPAYDRN
jgi:hypothetical protein